MNKRVLMISGDIGGAKSQLPVFWELFDRGIELRVVVDVDPRAKAGSVWSKEGVAFWTLGPLSNELREMVDWAQIVVAGSCGTAYQVEASAINLGNQQKRITVISSDFWFNHSYPYWRNVEPSYWLAIDEQHRADMLALRSNWSPERVVVTGQPAFDGLFSLSLKRKKIRLERRTELQINQTETAVLFWSLGAERELYDPSLESLLVALEKLASQKKELVFIPRIHPKLVSIVGEDYYRYQEQRIIEICDKLGIRIAKADEMPVDELNLAADLVISNWSTQSITSAMLGVPTLNIFLPVHQEFCEKNFCVSKPYLPTLKCGAVVGAFSLGEIDQAIQIVLNPLKQKEMNKNAAKFMPIKGGAARRIADFLASLA